MPGLEEFITLEEASRRYHVDRETLTRLVAAGNIKAIRVDGRLAVDEQDIALIALKEQISSNGDEIVSISEAARRLGINSGHISLWVSYGWIPVLGHGPRRAKLISFRRAEALARLREKQGLRGRRLIPRGQEALVLS